MIIYLKMERKIVNLSAINVYTSISRTIIAWLPTIRKHVEHDGRKWIEKGDLPEYLWKRVVRIPVGDGDQSPIRSPSVVSAT